MLLCKFVVHPMEGLFFRLICSWTCGRERWKKKNGSFYLVVLLVKLIDVNFPLMKTMVKSKDCIVEVFNPKTKTIQWVAFVFHVINEARPWHVSYIAKVFFMWDGDPFKEYNISDAHKSMFELACEGLWGRWILGKRVYHAWNLINTNL